MGVATPWPKGAMPPSDNLKKKTFFAPFDVFYVLLCHLFAFYTSEIVKTTHLFMHLPIVETKKWLGLKLFYKMSSNKGPLSSL